MTSDAELCRACAEAIGMRYVLIYPGGQLLEAGEPDTEWNPLDNAAQAEQVEWALIEAGCVFNVHHGYLAIHSSAGWHLASIQLNSPADKRRLLCEALAKLRGKNG